MPADRPGRVGVISQIDGSLDGLLERVGIVKGPQSRLQAFDHPARPFYVRGLLVAKISLGGLLNQRVRRLDVVEDSQGFPVRGKNGTPVLTTDKSGEDRFAVRLINKYNELW